LSFRSIGEAMYNRGGVSIRWAVISVNGLVGK
jgi:hypothetical protein